MKLPLLCPPSQSMTDTHEDCWRVIIFISRPTIDPDLSSTEHIIQRQRTPHHSHTSDSVSFSKHQASIAFEILQIIYTWLDDQDFGRIMAATRATSRLHNRSIRNKNRKFLRKASERMQSWRRRLDWAEIRTAQTLSFSDLPDYESDEDDFDHGALLDRAHQVTDRDEANQHQKVHRTEYGTTAPSSTGH